MSDEEWSDASGELHSDVSDSEDASMYADDDENEVVLTQTKQEPFEVWDVEEVAKRLESILRQVSDITTLGRSDAARLLRKFEWNTERGQEEWFSRQAELQEELGIAREPVPAPPDQKEATCGICWTDKPASEMTSGPCGHPFCADCWRHHLAAQLEMKDAKNALLSMRCMQPGCGCAISLETYRHVVDDAFAEKYRRHELEDFVEASRAVRHCPAADCAACVHTLRPSQAAQEVTCSCGTRFCFDCSEEPHRPSSCHMVQKWLAKSSAEAANMQWILANTKPCPKCQRPIEKNAGCMHMNCSQCRYEFCWLCLQDWSKHGEGTGGFYNCNMYEERRRQGEFSKEERMKKGAQRALDRWVHYFERYDFHTRGSRSWQEELAKRSMRKISENTATPESQLKFKAEVGAMLAECKRVLKWTYCYGYWTWGVQDPEEGAVPEALQQRRAFFEFNQGFAELLCEKLYQTLKDGLERFEGQTAARARREHPDLSDREIQGKIAEEWSAWRADLMSRCQVTEKSFHNLITELERGFDRAAEDYGGAGPSGAAEGAAGAAGGAGAASAVDPEVSRSVEAATGIWACTVCTFMNEPDVQTCGACNTARPR
ncbi:unnamed protein product [Pedinophyceae sp. YPF-701]|nr:unnamed protein product [Pedinophyceae sp. YPF-701]